MFPSMELVLRLQAEALVFESSLSAGTDTTVLAQHSLGSGPLLGLLLWLFRFASLPGVQAVRELGTLLGGLWGQKGQCLPESTEK